ncbi:MAG TPA: hypothetical protein VFQ00_01415 [Terriglobales bacterium]|nr:hypothetical protein [Terriglobales bacterium]
MVTKVALNDPAKGQRRRQHTDTAKNLHNPHSFSRAGDRYIEMTIEIG